MKPAIMDIPGIGPAAAAALAEHRIKTLAGLARASVEKVSAVPGFSEARAIKVIAEASALLAAADKTPVVKDKPAGHVKKDMKARKDKGKAKKGKGKEKKKDKKNKGKKKGKGKGKGTKKDKK